MDYRKLSLAISTLILPISLFAAKPGFYVGAGIGQAVGPEKVTIVDNNFNYNTGGTITGQYSDVYNFYTRGAILYHLLAGYNFNPYLGIEVSYSYLGRQDLASFGGGVTKNFGFDGTLDSFYYGITGVGHIPLDRYCADLFAKAGWAKLHSEIVINDPNGVIFVNPGKYQIIVADNALIYGIGGQYYLFPQLAAEIEWNRISRFNDSKIGNVSYNQFLFGVNYSFSIC